MWDTVELRELRVLTVLAEELHFGRTAERLSLTSGRVSQVVARLETVLGGPLVERTSRRVALTEDGARLVERVRPVIADLERALQETHTAIGAVVGTLRVGVLTPSTAGPRFLDLVAAFEARYPTCELHVRDIAIGDALGPLRRGEIDAIAVRLPLEAADVTVGPLLSDEPRVLAVAAAHPLATAGSVTLDDLAGERVARMPGLPAELEEAILPRTTPSGRPIARHDEAPASIAELMAMVARGEIVHLTSPSLFDYVGHPGIVQVPVNGMPRTQSALAWRRDSRDARVAAFAQLVAEHAG